MQALGNDFIVIDGEWLLESSAGKKLLKHSSHVLPALAHNLCSRRLGIGADGLVLALNLKRKELALVAHELYGGSLADCDFSWTFTNCDGSTSQTCGNALRCLALWAHRKGLFKDRLKVLTANGPVEISFLSEEMITADLGTPKLACEQIPYTGFKQGQIVNSPFTIGKDNLSITCVNMGNPHCLIFSGEILKNLNDIDLPFVSEDQLDALPDALAFLASEIQNDPRFPESVNVSFVLVHDRNSADAVVFERGCGPTMACGSAAAAILVAGVLEGRLERQARITLPGGTLSVEWSLRDDRVLIGGPARFVFEGQFVLELSFLDIPSRATPLRAS